MTTSTLVTTRRIPHTRWRKPGVQATNGQHLITLMWNKHDNIHGNHVRAAEVFASRYLGMSNAQAWNDKHCGYNTRTFTVTNAAIF